MPKRGTFPIWTRNRAARHAARGCSRLLVGLILGAGRRRPPLAEARPSNVLPFLPPAGTGRRPPPAGDLRHG